MADAAHELRSPLTALSLQAERLGAAEMSVEAQQRLSALREGMQRTRRLLDQLLALARAQESSPEIAPPVSMHKVFRQVIERLLPNAEAKSIDLGVCSASDAQLAVAEVDLMTLIGNLVDNAIKYTPNGGRSFLVVGTRDGGVVVHRRHRSRHSAGRAGRRVRALHRLPGSTETGSGLGSRSPRRSPNVAAHR